MGLDAEAVQDAQVSLDADGCRAHRPRWTTKDDPRRTRLGTFIRTTSIDEFPQFINVLMGDMSLVGPRPEQPAYVEQFQSSAAASGIRLTQQDKRRIDAHVRPRIDAGQPGDANVDECHVLLTFVCGNGTMAGQAQVYRCWPAGEWERCLNARPRCSMKRQTT